MTISGQNANGGAIYQFVRGSTAICIGNSAGSRPQTSGGVAYISDSNVYSTISGNFLDSPSTTSSTTSALIQPFNNFVNYFKELNKSNKRTSPDVSFSLNSIKQGTYNFN